MGNGRLVVNIVGDVRRVSAAVVTFVAIDGVGSSSDVFLDKDVVAFTPLVAGRDVVMEARMD